MSNYILITFARPFLFFFFFLIKISNFTCEGLMVGVALSATLRLRVFVG